MWYAIQPGPCSTCSIQKHWRTRVLWQGRVQELPPSTRALRLARLSARSGREDRLAPVDSRNRGVTEAKKVVRKAVFFTTNHVTEQIRALGWATSSVGSAAAERIEALEARVRDLEARLRDLEGASE